MIAREIVEKIKRYYWEIDWIRGEIFYQSSKELLIEYRTSAFVYQFRKSLSIHHFLEAEGDWQGLLDDYIMIMEQTADVSSTYYLPKREIEKHLGQSFFVVESVRYTCHFIKVEADSDAYLNYLDILKFKTLEEFLDEMSIRLVNWNDYGYYNLVNLHIWGERFSVRINPLNEKVLTYLKSPGISVENTDFSQVKDKKDAEWFLKKYLPNYNPQRHEGFLAYLKGPEDRSSTQEDRSIAQYFCSLGDQAYYEFLKKYLPYKERQNWFRKTRDLAYNLKPLGEIAKECEDFEDPWAADFNFAPPYGKVHNFFNNSFMRNTSLKEIREVLHPLTIAGWEEGHALTIYGGEAIRAKIRQSVKKNRKFFPSLTIYGSAATRVNTIRQSVQKSRKFLHPLTIAGWEEVHAKIKESIDEKIKFIDYDFKDASDFPTVLRLRKPTEESALPMAVYALVGGNGSGKSHRIRQIIESHINDDNRFSQLLHFSLSPFDEDVKPDGLVTDDNGDMVYEKVGFVSIRKSFFNEVKEKLTGLGLDKIRTNLIETAQKKGLLDDNEHVIVEKAGMKERFIWYIQYLLLDLIAADDKLELWSASLNFFAFELWAREVQQAFRDKEITLADFEWLETLSSGQATILLYLTKLASSVNQGSLIIFDEPETFMHPPMVKAFIRAVSEICKKKKALCLVATHSPVIIQEIPHSNVYRLDESYRFTKPHYKTYGQNLDTLYKTIYGVELQRTGYNELLNERGQQVIEGGGHLLPEEELQYLGDEAYLKFLLLEEWIRQGGDGRLNE